MMCDWLSTLPESIVQEQIDQERLQVYKGHANLEQNTYKAERNAYASSSIYGVTCIQELLPAVVAAIEGMHSRIHERKNGRYFKEIHEYLGDIEPLIAAGITCKIVFDKVFSTKDDDDNLTTNVYDAVGTAIMQECQMRYYQRKAPGLLHVLKKNYWHAACGTQQKLTNVQIMMNRADICWQRWSRDVRVRLGSILVDAVLTSSGWFEDLVISTNGKRNSYLVPSALFCDIKDKVLAQAHLFSAEQWVMLVPPRPWTETTDGGYILDEVMRGHDMVRRGNRCCIQGEKPIAFLNKIQEVAYRLNPFVVEVAELMYEKGYRIGKFIPHTSTEPLPNKPVDIDTNADARKQYCRDAAQVHNRNRELVSKAVRTRLTMDAVSKFKDKDRYYIPWSFDYRGRVYPIPSLLTPHDTDFGKSLIQFADGAYMTPEAEEWLAFQVATQYGLDKKPIKERLEWVHNNFTLISAVATDPVGNMGLWVEADEPWQFLAACDEYYHCCIECDRQFTHIPVSTDATCSGMQILAGLARDKSTASLVNVLPSEAPQDAYKAVAAAAQPNIPERWREHVDRGVAKRLVMTIPYNAKFKSNWRYVNEALNDKKEDGGKELGVPKEDITAITHALRDAVFKLFPGPTNVMKWIEKEVGRYLKTGATDVVWTTPSGFIVTQRMMKPETMRMKTQLMGEIKQTTIAIGDSDTVNVSKHKAATSPNLIHSLDASLLHLSAIRFNAPIALIHDSVLCRATDMSVLSVIVRETYIHLFAEHDYLRDWALSVGAESEPPIIGDLEPESVIESTYFFC